MKQFLIKKHSYRYAIIEAEDSKAAIAKLNEGEIGFSNDGYFDNSNRFSVHEMEEVAIVPSNDRNEKIKGRY